MLIQVICGHSDVSDHVSTAVVLFTHLGQKFDVSISCDSTGVFMLHLEIMASTNAEIKKIWIYISTPTYVFMA
jgi:hypothetical protein